MKRAVLPILVVCLVAATVPHLGAQMQAPPGYPAAGQPSIVTVLSNGAEPRRALRYGVANGSHDHMRMDMLLGMTMNMGGMDLPVPQMPTMRMGADFTVTDVTPAGDAAYKIGFTEMGWVADAGVDPQVMAMLQSTPIDTKQFQVSGVVSNRGVGRDLHMDLGKGTDPQMAQVLGSMSSSIQNMSMPLPEEAVGIGARWQVRQTLEVNGIRSYQSTVFELISLDDKGCSLKTTLEQTAPAQAMNNPMLPPGTEASIEKLTGSGTGTMKVRWDSLVPTSDAAIRSDMIMNMTVGGASQQITMVTTIKLSIAAAK